MQLLYSHVHTYIYHKHALIYTHAYTHICTHAYPHRLSQAEYSTMLIPITSSKCMVKGYWDGWRGEWYPPLVKPASILPMKLLVR